MSSKLGRLASAVACGAFGLAIAFSPAAEGAESHPSKVVGHAKASHGKKGAQSIGAPNRGHLAGAVRLRGSKSLRQREGNHSWGLPQLVHLIQHAAVEVARKHRGSQMLVGDLSGRTGGHLDRHGSHQTGRDADVGFYAMNSKGKPMAVKRFIPYDEAGNARDAPGVRFDEARNWTMIAAMLKDEKASVHYLFIANALRAKLLAYAAKKHVPKELYDRAASAMMSPEDAELHDDHVHVRISCPESMRDVCIEEAVGAPKEPGADEKAEHEKAEPKPEEKPEPQVVAGDSGAEAK